MIIDKTKPVSRAVAIIYAISAVLDLMLTIKGFVLYRFLLMLCNAALAVACFKDTGKDREICVLTFGAMAIFEVARIFTEDSLNIQTGVFYLLRILVYILIILYILGVLKNKGIVVACGIVSIFGLLLNLYNLAIAYRNIQAAINNLGIKTPTNIFMGVINVFTYYTPVFGFILLAIGGMIKFTNKK